jgi:hypothetical protein
LTRIESPGVRRFWSASRPWLSFVVVIALATGSARATTVIPPEFAQLVGQADYVVRATVKNVSAEFRTTPKGRAIFTRVELEVLETIVGTPPQPLTLELLGGTVGEVTMRVEGVPLFHVGDEDILFVQANGRQFYPLVGIMHGKYPVKRDAKSGAAIVTRSNGVPLRDVSEVKGDLDHAATAAVSAPPALTPEAFAGKIRASYQSQFPSRPHLAK